METKKKFLMPVAVHPGALVKDWMEEKGVTASEMAALGGISEASLRWIIEGREDITPAVAAALERATGISADFWMRVQKHYEADWERLTRKEGVKAVRLTGVQGLESKPARSRRRTLAPV
ncbi:addiction module antidote protein, HigA family [Tannerella sp. oral taxon 808]|nr:addiction module antidote protein, HigA family [Tannerella sp. oral taxon 808]